MDTESLWVTIIIIFFLIKSWKTSAVSRTVWMVETQLCKLRGTSDTFVFKKHTHTYQLWGWLLCDPIPSFTILFFDLKKESVFLWQSDIAKSNWIKYYQRICQNLTTRPIGLSNRKRHRSLIDLTKIWSSDSHENQAEIETSRNSSLQAVWYFDRAYVRGVYR